MKTTISRLVCCAESTDGSLCASVMFCLLIVRESGITCEAEPHHAEECSVAWGQCGHSYHFHCLGEGTQVGDASGISFAIEKFPSNRSVLGFDSTKNGIVPAK